VLALHVATQSGYLSTGGAWAWLLSRGEIGVPVFFTLSGLLLYRPWVPSLLEGRSTPAAGRYLWKRALRILPAYWCLVVYAIGVYGSGHVADVWSWLKLATLTYSYDPHPWWGSSLGPQGMGQAWSLTIEVAWYVTLPATAAVLAWYTRRGEPADETGDETAAIIDRRARRLLVAIGVYGVLSCVYTIFMFTPSYTPVMAVWLPRYLAWFAVGMALAVLSVWATAQPDGAAARFCRTISYSWAMCWLVAALVYCIASTPATGPQSLFDLSNPDTTWTSELHTVLYALVAAFFIAPVALAPQGQPVMDRLLGNRVMRHLGTISYSIFLWQIVVMLGWFDLTSGRFFTHSLPVAFVVVGSATIVVAELSYLLVEKPALRLAHRRNVLPPRAEGHDQASHDDKAEQLGDDVLEGVRRPEPPQREPHPRDV
jgi:peptidoglycan/LPS O-acetylase OafA/YrhL